MIKTVIFDLDGTLVDTIGGIAWACNHALKKNGFPTRSVEEYLTYVGSGLANTMYMALPDSDNIDRESTVIKQLITDILEIYNKNPLIDTKLYDGILDMLSVLKKMDIKWGIHTNKHDYIAQQIADEFFDRKEYIGLVGTNDEIPKKPNPKGTYELIGDTFNRSEVLFVGDTEVDIKTSEVLGVKSVAVSWGFRTSEHLASQKPSVLIDKPEQLIAYIKQLA